MVLKFMLVLSCLNFVKILLLNFFPKKYHSWVIKIHSAILICYFLYLGNFIGVFTVSVVYCLPNLSGTLKNASESRDNNSITAKNGSGNQSGTEDSVQQTLHVQNNPTVGTINMGDPNAAGNLLAGGAMAAGLTIAVTMPGGAVPKVAALAISSITAIGLANGGSALRELNQTFNEIAPIIQDALRDPQSSLYKHGSGSGFPSSPVANSVSETGIVEKLSDFVTPTVVNNPIVDFSSHFSLLLGIVLVLNLYVLLTLTFRDPIVQKITEKLSKYGKIGFVITKYIEFLTTFNRYVLIMALAWCISVLYVLITWMGILGSMSFLSR